MDLFYWGGETVMIPSSVSCSAVKDLAVLLADSGAGGKDALDCAFHGDRGDRGRPSSVDAGDVVAAVFLDSPVACEA